MNEQIHELANTKNKKNMIPYIYTVSFLIATVGLIGWFVFQDKKLGRQASLAFFLGLATYLSALWFAPVGLHTKAFVLMRDFGVMAGVGMLFQVFRHNKLIAAGIFAALLVSFGTFYLELLYETIPNKRIFTSERATEGELLIEVKEGHRIADIHDLIDKYELEYSEAFNQLSSPEMTDLDDYYLIDVPDNQLGKIHEIKTALQETDAVEYLEDNEIVKLDDELGEVETFKRNNFLPNDPFVKNQWGYDKINAGILGNLLKKDNVKPKKRALVVILDTGVDAQHEDIKGNFVSINKKHNTDKQSHGTHCAGIAAAVSGNRIGIASVVSDNQFVQVSSVKVLNDYGRGTQQTIIKGILEAADNGADVISMSLGGPSNDSRQKAYKKAFEYAKKKGAIIVVAAGNSNANAKMFVPAGVEGVISVSAVDADLNRASFSNFVSEVKMGIAAPGVNIYSTLPNNRYGSFNGTSMACPHVAGVLGMMKALKPNLTTNAAYKILKTTGIDTRNPIETGQFIQPDKAIEAMLK